ncbi:MAG: ribose-phosphate pyrophosphokinase-like domain-containing protein [Candidatus Aenigmatarchaeota archaeon]
MLSSSNSKSLVEKIAKHTNLPLAQPIKIFPDGEIYVRIDFDLGREGVFLIQSMFPNQNDAIIEVLLLTDTSIDLRTKRAVGIFLVYSRQDKRFQNGEALSIKTSARLFKAVSIKEIITVDAHSHRKPQKLFFGISCTNISAGKLY